MLEIGLSRLMMCRISLQDLSGGVPRFSRHPQIQEIAVRTFSIQLGQTRSKRPIGSDRNVFTDPIPDRNHVHLIWILKVPTVIYFNPFRTAVPFWGQTTRSSRRMVGPSRGNTHATVGSRTWNHHKSSHLFWKRSFWSQRGLSVYHPSRYQSFQLVVVVPCGLAGLCPFSPACTLLWSSSSLLCRYPADWRDTVVLPAPRYLADWRDSTLSVPRYSADWRDSVLSACRFCRLEGLQSFQLAVTL